MSIKPVLFALTILFSIAAIADDVVDQYDQEALQKTQELLNNQEAVQKYIKESGDADAKKAEKTKKDNEPKSWKCSYCGKKNKAGAHECAGCGAAH